MMIIVPDIQHFSCHMHALVDYIIVRNTTPITTVGASEAPRERLSREFTRPSCQRQPINNYTARSPPRRSGVEDKATGDEPLCWLFVVFPLHTLFDTATAGETERFSSVSPHKAPHRPPRWNNSYVHGAPRCSSSPTFATRLKPTTTVSFPLTFESR